MVRAPCCEKMGLRKGPWSVEEDQILVSFIQKHGHGNWRALPKQAGLLRCGKSCRLRWINYLRPDIKRGNLSREEEETIIELHEKLGNRWSAIAAKLPGRTDNEIKNVWHTHIKKKLKDYQPLQNFKGQKSFENPKTGPCDLENCDSNQSTHIVSEMSSVTESSIENTIVKNEEMDYTSEYFPQIDESFWSEDSPNEHTNLSKWFIDEEIRFDSPPAEFSEKNTENVYEGTDFWHNVFIKAAEIPNLPDL